MAEAYLSRAEKLTYEGRSKETEEMTRCVRQKGFENKRTETYKHVLL